MKKLIVLVIIAAIVALSAVAMVACTDKEEVVRVDKIVLEVKSDAVFYVGDAFDASKFTITATLTDKTEVVVTNTEGVFYDKTGLKLAAGKYSEAGKAKLKVIYLDKYESEVEITVNEAK